VHGFFWEHRLQHDEHAGSYRLRTAKAADSPTRVLSRLQSYMPWRAERVLMRPYPIERIMGARVRYRRYSTERRHGTSGRTLRNDVRAMREYGKSPAPAVQPGVRRLLQKQSNCPVAARSCGRELRTQTQQWRRIRFAAKLGCCAASALDCADTG
jgi:hypothetical protein